DGRSVLLEDLATHQGVADMAATVLARGLGPLGSWGPQGPVTLSLGLGRQPAPDSAGAVAAWRSRSWQRRARRTPSRPSISKRTRPGGALFLAMKSLVAAITDVLSVMG